MSNPREFFLIISNTNLQKVIRIILTGKEVRILIFKRNQTFFYREDRKAAIAILSNIYQTGQDIKTSPIEVSFAVCDLRQTCNHVTVVSFRDLNVYVLPQIVFDEIQYVFLVEINM